MLTLKQFQDIFLSKSSHLLLLYYSYCTNLSVHRGNEGLELWRLVGFEVEDWKFDQTLQQQMQPGSQTSPGEVYLLLPAIPGD